MDTALLVVAIACEAAIVSLAAVLVARSYRRWRAAGPDGVRTSAADRRLAWITAAVLGATLLPLLGIGLYLGVRAFPGVSPSRTLTLHNRGAVPLQVSVLNASTIQMAGTPATGDEQTGNRRIVSRQVCKLLRGSRSSSS